MDLSLALGRPTGNLTEREFARWRKYANKRMLPQRRLELYLAQIARQIAATMGGSDAPLSDFLFDPPPTKPPKPDKADLDAAKQAFNFRPSKPKR